MFPGLPRCLAVIILSLALVAPVWGGLVADAAATGDPGPSEPRAFPDQYGPASDVVYSPLRVPPATSEEGPSLRASEGGPRLVLNVAARRLYVYLGENLALTYPVAVGRADHPTPTGSCVVVSKACNPTWYPSDGNPPVPPGPSNPLGTRWMGWSLVGFGLHGTNADWSIGRAVSLGCVRLRNADAEAVFDLVRIGTPLTVVYEPVELAVFPPEDESAGGAGAGRGEQSRVVLGLETDVYDRVPDYRAFLEVRLAQAGRPLPSATVTWLVEALERYGAVTWDTASPVFLGDRRLDTPILRLGRDGPGEVASSYVSVRAVAGALGARVGWDEDLGRATVDGLTVAGLNVDGQVFATLEELARVTGTHLDWVWERRTAVRASGEETTSEAAGQLLVRHRLTIFPGLVYVDGSLISKKAFRLSDGTYVPLRPLAQALGLALDWTASPRVVSLGGVPIPVVVVDGRSFARDGDLAALLTGRAWIQVTSEGLFVVR